MKVYLLEVYEETYEYYDTGGTWNLGVFSSVKLAKEAADKYVNETIEWMVIAAEEDYEVSLVYYPSERGGDQSFSIYSRIVDREPLPISFLGEEDEDDD